MCKKKERKQTQNYQKKTKQNNFPLAGVETPDH